MGVCRWTSELPLRGSFSKRSTGRQVNGSLSLSTILYMCQPHSTQLQKATLLLQHLIRLKGTFCCIDGWWVYLGGSRNCLLDGSSMACSLNNIQLSSLTNHGTHLLSTSLLTCHFSGSINLPSLLASRPMEVQRVHFTSYVPRQTPMGRAEWSCAIISLTWLLYLGALCMIWYILS